VRKSSSDPIGTLSVGNVVSTAVTLYKSNFRDYFSASLQAVGWLFLGLIGLVLPGMAAGVFNNALLTVLAGIIWIVFFGFCLGKSAVSRAIISRLAYQQLSNRPETMADASRQLAPKHWKFLILALWLGLFLFGVYLLSYLVLLALGGFGVFLSTQIPGAFGGILLAVFALAGLIAFVWLIIRFYSYWFVAELPLSVEDRVEPLDSIGSSRQLSLPFVWRIQLIVLVAFLITLPLNLIANLPGIASLGMMMEQLRQVGTSPAALESLGTGNSYVFLQIASAVLGFLLELFIVPFWQAIKSVVYFDLRSRREGADLQMR
jgi:hypothetical protein